MSDESSEDSRPVINCDAKSNPSTSPISADQDVGEQIGASPDADLLPDLSEASNAAGERLLTALWRTPDRHTQIGILDRQTGRFNNRPVTDIADAIALAQQLSSEGAEVYFACAEYLTPDSRTSANAAGACGFWMDIDCGEDKAAAGKGYPTVKDAEDALSKFCKDTGLPKPTLIVYSGGGLHVYWALDRDIPRELWQAHARKLKDLCKACGFLADDSRTADIASVMRIPGTLNHKNSPPRPVSLEYAATEFIDRSVMLDAIAGAHNRLCNAAVTQQPNHPATTYRTSAKYAPPDLAKLGSALFALDPDCDEATWKLKRLAPLALAAYQHPELATAIYGLARSWSSGDLCGHASKAWSTPGGNSLTGEAVFDDVWQRFLSDGYPGEPITIGTIFYDAKHAGWEYPTEADPDDEFKIITFVVEGDAS